MSYKNITKDSELMHSTKIYLHSLNCGAGLSNTAKFQIHHCVLRWWWRVGERCIKRLCKSSLSGSTFSPLGNGDPVKPSSSVGPPRQPRHTRW